MKPLLCFALVTLLSTSQAAFAQETAASRATEETIAKTGVSAGIDAGYGMATASGEGKRT